MNTEIVITPDATIPAGTYNFAIHITTGPVEGDWRGQHTFTQNIRASHACLLIAETCLGHHPDRVNWLFLNQDGDDFLHLNLMGQQ